MSQTNEIATVPKFFHFSELNKAQVYVLVHARDIKRAHHDVLQIDEANRFSRMRTAPVCVQNRL